MRAGNDPNTFGTHEFMGFLDLIGAKAYLSANVGERNSTRNSGLDGVYAHSTRKHTRRTNVEQMAIPSLGRFHIWELEMSCGVVADI